MSIELGAHNSTEQRRGAKSRPRRASAEAGRGVTGVSLRSPLLLPLPRDALFLVVILVVFLSVVPLGRGEQLCGYSGAGTLELVDLLLGDVALRVVEVEQRAHILRLRLVLIRMQREELVDELGV